MLDAQSVVEEHGRNLRAVQQVLQVAVEALHRVVLALQLTIDRLQLFVDRLQLLLGGLEFFVGGLQLFGDGLILLRRGLHVLDVGLELIGGGLQLGLGCAQLLFQGESARVMGCRLRLRRLELRGVAKSNHAQTVVLGAIAQDRLDDQRQRPALAVDLGSSDSR